MLNHCYIFPLISIQCLTDWVPYRSSLIICCILCALDRSQQDTPRGNLLPRKDVDFLLRYHLYTFEDHFEDYFEPVRSSDVILHISRVILPQDALALTFQRPASHVGMNMCYSRVSLRYTICLHIIRMKTNLWSQMPVGCHPRLKQCHLHHPPVITILIGGIYKPFPVMGGKRGIVLPTWYFQPATLAQINPRFEKSHVLSERPVLASRMWHMFVMKINPSHPIVS